jgi:hypothetical protein
MMRLVLAVTIVNTALAAGLLWLLFKRRLRQSELEIILDALDETRGTVALHAEHTAGEHSQIFKILKKVGDRLQFLVAKDIAGIEAEIREAAKAARPLEQISVIEIKKL